MSNCFVDVNPALFKAVLRLPNANDGVDWGSNNTDQINPGASSGYVTNNSNVNGFTVTCPTTQANCGYKYSVGGDFEVTGTATVSADDIKLYSNTITQSMLDNGVTLDSHVDVANCESTQGNCESKGGANDSHTTTVVLKDNSGKIVNQDSQEITKLTNLHYSISFDDKDNKNLFYNSYEFIELDPIIILSKFYPWIVKYSIEKGLDPDKPRYLTKVTKTF